MYLEFSHSPYLIFFLAVPLLFGIYLITLRVSRRKALQFANFEAIARVKGIDIFSKNIFSFILSAVILVLIILSLSGMTLHTVIKASSFSFVIAIDSSKSMSAVDVLPTRLDAAKEFSANFIRTAPISTRIGVISFSGSSMIEQELTDNKDLTISAIKNIGLREVEGTDLDEAVITSTNLLRGENGKSIILVGDGQINVGKIQDAIDYANKNDVIINAIGVGTLEGGRTDAGFSKLEEDTLKALAFNTGGKYILYNNTDINGIFNLALREVGIDLSAYLLMAALVLFILQYFLANTRFKIFP